MIWFTYFLDVRKSFWFLSYFCSINFSTCLECGKLSGQQFQSKKRWETIWGKPIYLLVGIFCTCLHLQLQKMNMSRLRDVLMENNWNMFCKSPHTKVCLTCHGKRSDWFEKMTIRTNSEVLGLKRDHREIWWCGRGALAWLAIEHLQLSIIQFCAVELEISSPLKWKYITFCIGNLEMCSPSKFAKGQFQPMFDNLKPDFHGSDSFQFISKTSKGTRQDDVQIQIYIKQPA